MRRLIRLPIPCVLLFAAGLPLLACFSGLGHDIDCLDDPFNNSDECVHDATVRVSGLDANVGRTLLVRVMSTGSRRDESESVTITTPTVSVVFHDFIREGGGPYEVRAVVDLDGDGSCDDPPADAVWQRGSFDDDDEEWSLSTSVAMATCD